MDLAALEQSIDPRRTLAALGYIDISEPVRITGGWETLIWRFQTADGGDHSLRVYFVPGSHAMARREMIALRTCEEAGQPAPRIEKFGEHEGMPAAVLTWCPGLPILTAVEQKPWQILKLSRMFGRAHAHLHTVAAPAELQTEAPDEWLGRVPEYHKHLARGMKTVDLATDILIHMDFHPLNVVGVGNEVTGILDWAGAAAGDRRADLARTHFTLAGAPIPPGPMKPLFVAMRGLMIRSWRAGYKDVAGPLPDYRQFMAWAGATLVLETERVLEREAVWATREDFARFKAQVAKWERFAPAATP
ncbi:MAG TPA: phosphotransferase [Dehalococcoidia bacterium]|nr:phosphotransferase [Dehalococcoidia bacterium]